MKTPNELRSLVEYDPNTGALTWKPRSSQRFNTNSAGLPAFANISRDGYFTGRMLGVNYKAHRVAWALFYGTWPDGQVDHINGDRKDNRIANLRSVTNAENARNQRLRKANTSGHSGIYWFARDCKWWVKIVVHGKAQHVGYFDNLEEAIVARDEAYKHWGFHENHGH